MFLVLVLLTVIENFQENKECVSIVSPISSHSRYFQVLFCCDCDTWMMDVCLAVHDLPGQEWIANDGYQLDTVLFKLKMEFSAFCQKFSLIFPHFLIIDDDIPWRFIKIPTEIKFKLNNDNKTSVCRVYEVSGTCVKSKVKHQLVLRWLKTNDKLQSLTRSLCSICQYCNGDVERQD